MSFRYNTIGAPCVCRAVGSEIEVRTLYGKVESFTANLNVNTSWQQWSFDGEYAQFVLFTEEVVFVGRRDGSWSGFDKKGDLVRMGTWNPPIEGESRLVGVYRGTGTVLHPAYLESNERIINIQDVMDKSYVLDEPIKEDTLMPTAISTAATEELNHLYVILKGGMLDVERSGHFAVPAAPGGKYTEVGLCARNVSNWSDNYLGPTSNN